MQDQSIDSPEQWRPVVGWENRYEVSDLGRVRNIGPGAQFRGRILKPTPHYKSRYLYVHLKRKPIRQALSVHSLVMAAFVGPCPEAQEINHCDNDRANCRLSNLEYVTHRMNIHQAWTTGGNVDNKRAYHRGENHANSKFTNEQVRAIRALTGRWGLLSELAREYGVSPTCILNIRNRKAYASVN